MSTVERYVSPAALIKHPEFEFALQDLRHAATHADKMYRGGKLTASEYIDFRASQFSELIDALPVDEFHAMMKDGRLTELQTLAGHDGKRDSGDVDDARAEISRKIRADALDDAWLDERIDSKQYAEMGREVHHDGDLDALMADGDFDGAASEQFASRHDRHDAPAKDLASFLEAHYGKGETSSPPPGRVSNRHMAEGEEPGYVPPVKDRIIDHDAPAEGAE